MSTPTGTVTFLFTDVEGSTRLWEESREAMQFALARHDAILRQAIESKGGYIFATGGDAFSCAFQAASDALEAALSAQLALQEEPWPKIDVRVRMALHVGEAEERGGDYFGPTLNRTARVLSTAAGSEILVSSAIATLAVDSLPGESSLVDVGERRLKDLDRTEHVYRLTAPGLIDPEARAEEPAPGWSAEVAGDRRRSIAVLPFDVIAGDEHTEAVADGLVEDIISALAAWKHIPVASRNSTFAYRGKSMDIRQVAEELGVQFVLEGSLRQSGKKVRVAAQLIDGTNGNHLWAEHYDGVGEDAFDFQDRITRRIAAVIEPAIFAAEARHLVSKQAATFDAWDHLVQGRKLIEVFHPEEVEEGIGHLHVAIDLDPGFAEAYAWIGWAHWFRAWAHWVEDETSEYQEAIEWARKAIAIDPQNVVAHMTLAEAYLFRGDYHRGRREAQIALQSNPNATVSYFVLGAANLFSGDPAAAIESSETSIELDPIGISAFASHAIAGGAHFVLGEYDEAIVHARDALTMRGGYLHARVVLTASLAKSGAIGEAQAEAAEILRISPDFTIDLINQPYQPEHLAALIDGLRLAGLEDA